MAKELLASMQSETLAEKDSDCQTKRYLKIDLNNSNYKEYEYRYVKVGNKLEMLTENNKDKFINKTIEIRSPLFCIGVGKNRCLCNKCAGDFYYIMNKPNIGLQASGLATQITQMNLQKFHQNLVKTKQLDPDKLLI